jgi:N-acetylglucosamine kinase-like BadF-type ATPase
MDNKSILKALEEISEKLAIKVRYGNISSKGGLCRVYNKYYIIIDRKAAINTKIDTIINSIKKFDLHEIYIPPNIRSLIGEE